MKKNFNFGSTNQPTLLMSKIISTSSYCILPDKKLIIDIYDGYLTFDAFKGHKLHQVAEKNFDSTYTILSDFRTIEVRMTLEEVTEYGKFALANNMVGKRKAALVLSTPNQFVYAKKYDSSIREESGQQMFTFLSFDEALAWLGLTDSKDELMELIIHYRNEPMFRWEAKHNEVI